MSSLSASINSPLLLPVHFQWRMIPHGPMEPNVFGNNARHCALPLRVHTGKTDAASSVRTLHIVCKLILANRRSLDLSLRSWPWAGFQYWFLWGRGRGVRSLGGSFVLGAPSMGAGRLPLRIRRGRLQARPKFNTYIYIYIYLYLYIYIYS